VRAWQIFGIGVAVLIAALSLQLYEAVLAALIAIAIVGAIIIGFLLRPAKEVFYLSAKRHQCNVDNELFVDRDCLAIKLELVRLWLLFVPTFLAVAFLLMTSASGTIWNFSLINLFGAIGAVYLYLLKLVLFAVLGLTYTWLSERWVLRNVEVCRARSVKNYGGALSYVFLDPNGGYYGGEGFSFSFRTGKAAELDRIVLYRAANPQLSKIAMGCLFHRLVVIGRGIPDFEKGTAFQILPTEVPSE